MTFVFDKALHDAMQSTAWFPEEDEALLEQFNRWVQALGFILKCHLGSGDLTTDLQVLLALHLFCGILKTTVLACSRVSCNALLLYWHPESQLKSWSSITLDSFDKRMAAHGHVTHIVPNLLNQVSAHKMCSSAETPYNRGARASCLMAIPAVSCSSGPGQAIITPSFYKACPN